MSYRIQYAGYEPKFNLIILVSYLIVLLCTDEIINQFRFESHFPISTLSTFSATVN